jgi:hypothetical protein
MGIRIRDLFDPGWKNSDPGSGINIPDARWEVTLNSPPPPFSRSLICRYFQSDCSLTNFFYVSYSFHTLNGHLVRLETGLSRICWLGGVAASVGISCLLVDSLFYGTFTLVPLNFFLVNVYHNLGKSLSQFT